MQKVLVMETSGSGMRSEAIGWSAEDGDSLRGVTHHEVGLSPSPRWRYCFATPFHAIGFGWKLLAPPMRMEPGDTWEWWFVRDDEPCG